MIESLGNPRASPLPARDRQDNHSKSLKRTGRLEFRRLGEPHPEERFLKPSSHEADDYEENWEHEFLNSLAKEWCEKKAHPRNIIINPDDLTPSRPREIKTNQLDRKSSKSKRKQFEKYKAYAVRMKIPSYNQLGKFKAKEEKRSTATIASKPASSYHIKQIQESLHPKLEQLMKNCAKEEGIMVTDSINANISAHINANIFKKRSMKSQNREKKATIRKRSIKNSEKKKEETADFIRSNNQGLKKSVSPRGLKKFKVSLQDSCSPSCERRYCNDPSHQDSKIISDVNRSALKSELKTPDHATAKEKASASPTKRTYLKVSPTKEPIPSTTNYLQKGINFKRKSKIDEQDKSPLRNEQSKQAKQKVQEKQVKLESRNSQCIESPSKMIMKTIYTSKDVVKQKNKIPASSKPEQRQTKDVRSHKVFSFNSQDKYIRRILMENDWIINPDQRSKFYHLKWVFKPSSQDYNQIRPGQFINHIKNSHELTSKNYLNKNLKKSLSQWPSLYSHYPKCYDLAKDAEKQQFFEQFVKQFMMILLQNIYKYLREQRTELVQRYQEHYVSLIGDLGQYDTEKKTPSFLRVKKFRKIDMEAYKSYDSSCLIHMNLIIVALRYWRHIRKQQQMQGSEDGYHFLKFGQKEFEQHLNFLEMYSKMVTPSFVESDERYFEKEFYSTPADITIERIVKEYVYFQHQLGAQWEVSSQRNMWIIKPCSASRGNGIYLDDNCKEILFNSKGIQSKIVQKYIQRPLIFRNMKYGRLSNKKFDIRQWVLLRSVDPLEIYMFSHCYVRICSQEYNIFNINNLKSHLTNYSFNKQYYKNTSESVMDYQTFLSLLKEEFNVDYQQDIRPKIEEIVIKSIKSSQDLLDDFSKRCFSLLGYDILLDERCNPWLLEVNMSPACQERTQWLKEYLKQMGKGLLKIILPENYLKVDQVETNINTKLSQVPQAGHIKKIKTQMSQQSLNKQEQIKSNILIRYVDSIFADKYEQIYDKVEENNDDDDGFVLEPTEEDIAKDNTNQDEEIQITYEAFLSDHPDADEQPEETERMLVPSYPKLQKQDKKRPELQIVVKEDEDYDYNRPSEQNQVNFENIVNWDESNIITHNNRCDSNISSQFGVFQNAQGRCCQEKKPFKWHLICFEEYHHTKKQKELLLDVVGIRLKSQKLKFHDQRIDQYEEGQIYVQDSIRLIQNRIRSFMLIRKMKQEERKQEERQSLRVNFSRLGRNNSERESKSALLEHEEKSIWHYSYLHTYEDNVYQKIQVQRPQTTRLKQSIQGMVKIKSSSDTKFRQKIKSLVSNVSAPRISEESGQISKIGKKGRARLHQQSNRQIQQHKESDEMQSNNIEHLQTQRSDEEEPQQILESFENIPVENIQSN